MIGVFDRDSYPSMNEVRIVDKITRDDLAKTKNEPTYQVIDIGAKSYFDPETNQWIKIK